MYVTGYTATQKPRPERRRDREENDAMKKSAWRPRSRRCRRSIGRAGRRAEGTVPVIVKATSSEYWQSVLKGAQAAAKDLGIKVDELGSPKDDAAAQMMLESAAGSKPMAIVISPTITEALGDPVSAGDQGRHPGHRHQFRRQRPTTTRRS